MKTSTLLKTLSAVGILGTAVFSMNATANPNTTNPMTASIINGGCPPGTPPVNGGCGSPSNGGRGSSTGMYDHHLVGMALSENKDLYYYRVTVTSPSYNPPLRQYEQHIREKTLSKCQKASGSPCGYMRSYANSCVEMARNVATNEYFAAAKPYLQCKGVKREALVKCQQKSSSNPNQCVAIKHLEGWFN